MNKPKTLYIIGAVNIPDLDAGSLRILQFAEIYKKVFDQIIIAGKGDFKLHSLTKYDGKISLISFHKKDFSSFFDKLQTLLHPEKFFLHDLENLYEQYDITHIMVYSVLPKSAVKAIRKFTNAHNIKLFFDVVEFQSLKTQNLSSFVSFYTPNMYINKKGIKNGDSVITISSFLESYFQKKKCNVVRVPFVFDTSKIKVEGKNKNKETLSLIYAGNPRGKKDLLPNVIKGLSLLSESDKSKVKLRVFGISSKDVIKNKYVSKKIINETSKIVEYYGQIDREQIFKYYQESDFSVLLRNPKTRTSRAGFPTKVTESLSNGVPVICNLSSDLNFYLNSKNAVLLDGFLPDEFARKISYVIQMPKEELRKMKLEARKTALESLDVSLYRDNILKIVE